MKEYTTQQLINEKIRLLTALNAANKGPYKWEAVAKEVQKLVDEIDHELEKRNPNK